MFIMEHDRMARPLALAIFFLAFICITSGEDKSAPQPSTVTGKNKVVLFKASFAKEQDLSKWVSTWLKTPEKKLFGIVSENGEQFVRTSSTFGNCAPLKPEITIDDSIQEVGVAVTHRNVSKYAMLLGFALTSRKYPVGSNAFDAAKDSGMVVNGYHLPNYEANYIAWRKEGRQVTAHPIHEPFNLLLKGGEWVKWRLIYDNVKKTLSFFRDKDETAFIKMSNVDLTGVPLVSVWLKADGAEYLDVEVYYVKK